MRSPQGLPAQAGEERRSYPQVVFIPQGPLELGPSGRAIWLASWALPAEGCKPDQKNLEFFLYTTLFERPGLPAGVLRPQDLEILKLFKYSWRFTEKY